MIRQMLLSFGTALILTSQAFSAEAPSPLPTDSPTPPVPSTPLDPKPAEDSQSAITRSAVLELSGAFANDGYKIRDGALTQTITKEAPAILEVNLFAGNEYWFSASAAPQSPQKINVTIFDGDGTLVDQQTYDDGFRFAAGFEPTESGRYFVKVSLIEGDPTPISLVYSYK